MLACEAPYTETVGASGSIHRAAGALVDSLTKGQFFMRKAFLATASFFLLTTIASANWQSISSAQYSSPDNSFLGAARYRQGGTGNQLYVGVPDLGVAANRVEGKSLWTSGVAQTFSFNYTGTASEGSLGSTGTLSNSNALDGNASALFMVVRLSANQSINLTGMTLGSTNVSDLTINGGSSGGQFFYLLNGYSNSSLLSGNMTMNFTLPTSNERPVVEIAAAAVVPEPSTYAILVSGVAAVVAMRRRKRS